MFFYKFTHPTICLAVGGLLIYMLEGDIAFDRIMSVAIGVYISERWPIC